VVALGVGLGLDLRSGAHAGTSASASAAPGSAATALERAFQRTQAVTTVRLGLSESYPVTITRGSVSQTGHLGSVPYVSSATDLRADRASYVLTPAQTRNPFSTVPQVRPVPPMRVVVDGDRVWLSLATPAFIGALGPGRRWVQTSFAGVRATANLVGFNGLDLLQSLQQVANPHEIPLTLSDLGALRGAVSPRPIRGGYAFTVNSRLALARTPAAGQQRATLASVLRPLGVNFSVAGSVQISPVDGRIDAMTLRPEFRRGGVSLTEDIGLTLSGLDSPLSITPPSATQTKTVTPARLQQILDRTGASFFPRP
jgi:hypothetical protein